MTHLPPLQLKKHHDRRVKSGHPWIYSNEIATPLKSFQPGECVNVLSHEGRPHGTAFVNPHSLITARLYSRTPDTLLDEAFFSQKISSALGLRQSLFDRPFYRLVYGESDGLPGLVIDRFGDHLVLQLNTVAMDQARDTIVSALTKILPEIQHIFLKNDSTIRKQEQLLSEVISIFGAFPEKILMEENGFKFEISPEKGQKTGWFYDHRMNRARLRDYVRGKRVLDVFSYLGAWAIPAAGYGAKEVVCIDSSSHSAKGIMLNAQLNGVDGKISVITDDAFDALKNLQKTGDKFDVIVLDPPAFAKKQKDVLSGLAAYQRLNTAALKLLNPDGLLVSCSCSMQVSWPDFASMLHRAGWQNGEGSALQIIERGHQGPDHPVHSAIPETDYLKMAIVTKKLDCHTPQKARGSQ